MAGLTTRWCPLFKKLLIKLLLFYIGHRVEIRKVIDAARDLDVRGERKRSLVLNQLRTKFPAIAAKELALAIELILQEV